MQSLVTQLDPDKHSFGEFKEKLLADLPALERLVHTIREFCLDKQASTTTLPCKECPGPIKEKCNNPCEALEALLPRPYAGKFHGEGTTSLNFDETRDDHNLSNDLEEEDMKKLDHGALFVSKKRELSTKK